MTQQEIAKVKRDLMIELGYWGDEDDVADVLKRQAKPKEEPEVEEEEEEDLELFKGSRTWSAHFWGFWTHVITWKIIALFVFTFTVAHIGAATIWRVERASLYETVGKEVRLEYREKLACHLGYCLWIQRHDLSVDAPTLAEQVEEMKAEERRRYGLTERHQQEWHLPIAKTPAAPDILSDLGMNPSGH